MSELPVIREVIVVEGLHDRHAIDRAVQADCLISGGSAVSRSFLQQVARAQQGRGVIILTDPDYAGERIRKLVAQAVPGCKHAFLPRADAKKNGDIGIENASPQAIRDALASVRSEIIDSSAILQEKDASEAKWTWEEMSEWGLTGLPDSAWRREQLGLLLHIGYGNAKTFWKRLNMLGVTRAEFEVAYCQMEQSME